MTHMCSVELGGVPVFMAVTGEFDTEWRIVVACRDAKLYTITNGQVRGTAVVKKPQIELETQPCGLVRRDKQIYVATMDSQVMNIRLLSLPMRLRVLTCGSSLCSTLTSTLLTSCLS